MGVTPVYTAYAADASQSGQANTKADVIAACRDDIEVAMRTLLNERKGIDNMPSLEGLSEEDRSRLESSKLLVRDYINDLALFLCIAREKNYCTDGSKRPMLQKMLDRINDKGSKLDTLKKN